MSRINRPGIQTTFDAAADLSTHQYKFAIGAATATGGQLARVTVATANARVLGVLQNKAPAANLAAVVMLTGTSKLVVDGSGVNIAVGSPLKAGTAGVGVVAATDKDHVGAMALETSTAANDIIEVLIMNYDLGA